MHRSLSQLVYKEVLRKQFKVYIHVNRWFIKSSGGGVSPMPGERIFGMLSTRCCRCFVVSNYFFGSRIVPNEPSFRDQFKICLLYTSRCV